MIESGCLLSFYAETPVHCGSGSTFGAIDLPVQRERHTNLPILPAPSVKGVLKDRCPDDDLRVWEVFGPKNGNEFGGALSVTDARLLLFPVRASRGIFVWATSPFILQRLQRDAALAKPAGLDLAGIDKLRPIGEDALIHPDAPLSPVVLEDERFEPKAAPEMTTLINAVKVLLPCDDYQTTKDRLKKAVMVISDDHFERLCRTQTEVVTRNKLNERKTTTGNGGNMWIEEYVPSDAFFYSVLLAAASRKDSATKLATGTEVLAAAKNLLTDVKHIQIGGDESVGRGWMRLNWIGV